MIRFPFVEEGKAPALIRFPFVEEGKAPALMRFPFVEASKAPALIRFPFVEGIKWNFFNDKQEWSCRDTGWSGWIGERELCIFGEVIPNSMNPSEFKTVWTVSEQNLQPISLQTLVRFELDKETIDFLYESGLPNDAAPFLNFVGDIHPSDKYSTISLLTEWFDFLESEYSKYVIIGSDGNGDMIVINTKNHFIIEWLDHEDYFSSRFMNSSIGQLANCLLCYRDFIKTINAGKTVDESFDTEFTDGQFDILHDILKSIDQRTVQEGFWKEELELLLANREDTRSKH